MLVIGAVVGLVGVTGTLPLPLEPPPLQAEAKVRRMAPADIRAANEKRDTIMSFLEESAKWVTLLSIIFDITGNRYWHIKALLAMQSTCF